MSKKNLFKFEIYARLLPTELLPVRGAGNCPIVGVIVLQEEISGQDLGPQGMEEFRSRLEVRAKLAHTSCAVRGFDEAKRILHIDAYMLDLTLGYLTKLQAVGWKLSRTAIDHYGLAWPHALQILDDGLASTRRGFVRA